MIVGRSEFNTNNTMRFCNIIFSCKFQKKNVIDIIIPEWQEILYNKQ